MRIALRAGAVCAVTVLSAGTAATAVAHNDDSVIWGTVVSGPDLKVRDEPSTHGSILAKLPYGSQDRVKCAVQGTSIHGNPHWYWLEGVRGWVSAAYVDTGGRHVPSCASSADPCPQWRDRDHHDRDHRDCDHDPCAYRHH
ncbi:SH3 domain-containing protein [Streptomyces atriruber]|uniref:SH3 domain-containing protein n=1 Tax=Streptomyces atriruber TaxID=545121 RepID=UPI0006E2C4A7|nr:SH3 domain-containing protein [Streptomyces atriruber]